MTVNMTINNADFNLIDAIKSIIRLSPTASISFNNLSPIETSLLEDREEIHERINSGTIQGYSSMAEYRKAHAI